MRACFRTHTRVITEKWDLNRFKGSGTVSHVRYLGSNHPADEQALGKPKVKAHWACLRTREASAACAQWGREQLRIRQFWACPERPQRKGTVWLRAPNVNAFDVEKLGTWNNSAEDDGHLDWGSNHGNAELNWGSSGSAAFISSTLVYIFIIVLFFHR